MQLHLAFIISCLYFTYVQAKCENIPGEYGIENHVILNSQEEYIITFPPVKKTNPFRINALAINADILYPVLVVVRQQQNVMSWEIPMIIKNENGMQEFLNTSRTLCYNPEHNVQKYYRGFKESYRTFSISLSTTSPKKVHVIILVNEVLDYVIRDTVNYTSVVSPSQPVFYYYPFDNKHNKSSVFVMVNSQDDVCLTVSVQNSLCPVRDLNKEIEYEGKYQTMTTKGGLMIPKSSYPNGFFLVIVAKSDNYECTQESVILPSPKMFKLIPQNRISTVYFKVKETLPTSKYLEAMLITVGFYAAFCAVVILFVFLSYRFGKLRSISIDNDLAEEDVVDAPPKGNQMYFRKLSIRLMDLAHYEKRNQTKSFNYLWHILNIGLFYSIPVVQLMASYQRSVYLTGNQDICYHNLYCAHPLSRLSDFNHVFSNIGYVIVGILFLCITAFRQSFVKSLKKFGIPIHYGLYYAMGIALIIEGIMSACYHICPNQSNYQFDTSFMYVMAVLVSIKIYQNRHPDINASAYATFAVVGGAIFLAMFGILSGAMIVMVLFILCYIALCVYLSFKIYFFGDVLNGLKYCIKDFQSGEPFLSAVKPLRTGHFVLLIIANLCNYAMAGVGLYLYPTKTDFGTYLLSILMGNAILHTMFYMCMKLYCKERLCFESVIYGCLSLLTWISSSYFFFNNSTQWSATPAESKEMNNECLLMEFYDQHDIWHMLSAPALLFSFMLLMTIDDDLADKTKDEIDVF